MAAYIEDSYDQLSTRVTRGAIRTQKQQAEVDCLLDTMRRLDSDTLLAHLRAHLEARPDMDGDTLERWADAVRRTAWARQRGDMR